MPELETALRWLGIGLSFLFVAFVTSLPLLAEPQQHHKKHHHHAAVYLSASRPHTVPAAYTGAISAERYPSYSPTIHDAATWDYMLDRPKEENDGGN